MKPVIVLLGGPGSGKGTHGDALATALGYEHLSSGEHFREHIRRETPMGLRARTFIEEGQFVPDEVVSELMEMLLADRASSRGFVVDGYPRSLAQADAFEQIASRNGCRVVQALYLVVSDEEIVRRLSGRLTCRGCGQIWHEVTAPTAREGICDRCGGELFRRKDDTPVTIRKRIAVFHQMIGPLLNFYRESGRLTEVAAEGPRSEVSARVLARVEGAGS